MKPKIYFHMGEWTVRWGESMTARPGGGYANRMAAGWCYKRNYEMQRLGLPL